MGVHTVDNKLVITTETKMFCFDLPKAKEGKGIKTLTPNKLLPRLPILFAYIKVGNNSYKAKNKIRQILYLFHQHNKIGKKTLQQFNQVIITMGVHMVNHELVITTEPKTFRFDLPKDADNNLKHEIYSILKQNELLANKNEIRQLLSNYKHVNSIHKHRKQ